MNGNHLRQPILGRSNLAAAGRDLGDSRIEGLIESGLCQSCANSEDDRPKGKIA